jgi:hypothetical protein
MDWMEKLLGFTNGLDWKTSCIEKLFGFEFFLY